MKKQLAFLLLLLLFASLSYAQEHIKIRGYQGIVEVGGGLNANDSDFGSFRNTFFRADFVNGYKFNHSFSMGLGVGVRKFSAGEWLPPVYLNFRCNIGHNKFEKVYPFIQTKIGFPIFNQSIGLAFKNSPFTIDMGGEALMLFSGVAVGFISFGVNVGFSF